MKSKSIYLWSIILTSYSHWYFNIKGNQKRKISRADESRMRNWVTHSWDTHSRRSLKQNSYNMVNIAEYIVHCKFSDEVSVNHLNFFFKFNAIFIKKLTPIVRFLWKNIFMSNFKWKWSISKSLKKLFLLWFVQNVYSITRDIEQAEMDTI